MRKSTIALVTSTAVGLFLGASAASAADMGLPPPVYKAAPPAVYNWTGCYVGGQVGVGSQTDGFASNSEGGGLIDGNFGNNGINANGWGAVAGGQIGCNYQTGMLVVGVEADGLWSGISNKGSFSEGFGGVDAFSEGFSTQTDNKWDVDIALRVGVAFDRVLIYGKGGVAWGGFNFSGSQHALCEGVSCGALPSWSGSATLPGALIGLGMEYGLTQNWTAKIEYNYIAFAQESVSFPILVNGVNTGDVFSSSYGATKQLIKFGLNYKFW